MLQLIEKNSSLIIFPCKNVRRAGEAQTRDNPDELCLVCAPRRISLCPTLISKRTKKGHDRGNKSGQPTAGEEGEGQPLLRRKGKESGKKKTLRSRLRTDDTLHQRFTPS